MPALLTIGQAVRCLRDGDAIAYPTEALCGLGCDPADETAVRRIRDLASGRALRAG